MNELDGLDPEFGDDIDLFDGFQVEDAIEEPDPDEETRQICEEMQESSTVGIQEDEDEVDF